jgi:hypothetical protein
MIHDSLFRGERDPEGRSGNHSADPRSGRRICSCVILRALALSRREVRRGPSLRPVPVSHNARWIMCRRLETLVVSYEGPPAPKPKSVDRL